MTAETGFDPVRISDNYSATVNEAIFERLLTYDYLARPAKLVPMIAEAMPEVSDNGRTYTFRLRPGIHFTPDPAFKGAAARAHRAGLRVHVHALPRSGQPRAVRVHARGQDQGPGRARRGRAKKTGQFDYDAKLPDLEAVDRYTLRIRLARADYTFPLRRRAHVVRRRRARGDRGLSGRRPTRIRSAPAPYRLAEWKRASRIVLTANPDLPRLHLGLRGQARRRRGTQHSSAAMKGKTMPQIGRVEISIIEEFQTQWLAFRQKQAIY